MTTGLGERQSLSAALEEIRRRRGLRRRDVARAMGMKLRTYENFESGRGPMTYARLAAFADATNCDLVALLLCHHLGGSRLALACADNKAATIAVSTLQDIDAGHLVGVGAMTAANLLSAFELARIEALAAPGDDGGAIPILAPRQVECLRWVQEGKSSFAIGAILGISQHTVDDYIREACARLGVSTRIQAVSRAIGLGLLSP